MQDKIIYDDNGTLVDLTSQLNNKADKVKAFTFKSATDAIYIGSIFPFTSKHFKASVSNITSSIISIQYWALSKKDKSLTRYHQRH